MDPLRKCLKLAKHTRKEYPRARHGAGQQCGLGLLHGDQVCLRHGAAEPRQAGAVRQGLRHRGHRRGDVRGHHHDARGGSTPVQQVSVSVGRGEGREN